MVIRWLRDRQEAEGLTGEEMAQALGISPAAWSMLVNRKRGPTLRVLCAALKRYPEHWRELLEALLTEDCAA